MKYHEVTQIVNLADENKCNLSQSPVADSLLPAPLPFSVTTERAKGNQIWDLAKP
jgi:hypothetical protein